jgi:hypothetical protein
VSPFKTVSTKPAGAVTLSLLDADCRDCRMMNLKLNVSSSSLLSLRIKLGDVEDGNGSGS